MADNSFRWLDMSTYRLKATEVELNNGRSIIVMSGDIKSHEAALATAGVKLNTQIGRHIAAMTPDTLERLSAAFPDAKWVNEGDTLADNSVVSRSMFFRPSARPVEEKPQDTAPASGAQQVTTERPAVVEAFDITQAHYIGLNRLGNAVYQMPSGVRAIESVRETFQGKTKSYSADNTPSAASLSPALFLDGRATLEGRVAAVQGFVERIANGQSFRFDSLQRVAAIIFKSDDETLPAEDPRILQTFEAMNTAMSRRLASANIKTLSDVYTIATRLSDNFAVLREVDEHHNIIANGYIPPAVGVLMNRILGTETELQDKNISVDGVTFGAFFSRLPKTSHVVANAPTQYDAAVIRSMSRQAGLTDLTMSEGAVAPSNFNVQVLEKQFVDEPRTFAAGPGGKDLVLLRGDLIKYVEDLEARPEDGRTVSIIRFSDSDADLMTSFREWVGSHYAVDGAMLMPSSLVAGRVDRDNLLIYSVGRRRPTPINIFINDDGTVHPSMRIKMDGDTYQSAWGWATTLTTSRAKITNFHEDLSAVGTLEGNMSDAEENIYQKPYQSMSAIGSPTTMLPSNMERSVRLAQKRFIEEFGSPDEFVCNNLALTREQLKAGWSPEQVDAIAMGLASHFRGRGAFLLSDETGIGKGRTLLGLALFAAMQGKRVMYFTESADSFTDLYDEMRQMGIQDQFSVFTMGMTSTSTIYDSETRDVIIPGTPSSLQQALAVLRHWPDGSTVRAVKLTDEEATRLRSLENVEPEVADVLENLRGNTYYHLGDSELPDAIQEHAIVQSDRWNPNSNLIMTTFSQYNRPAVERVKKRSRKERKKFVAHDKSAWMQKMCDEETMVILDESHNAANDASNIGNNFNGIIDKAWFVGYSSATWAKMAKNMGLYRRALPPGMNVVNLGETLQKGGETLQETLSSMLTQDGVLLRREHDLSNCEFATYIDPDAQEKTVDLINEIAPILSRIAITSGEVSAQVVRLNEQRADDYNDRHNGLATPEMIQKAMAGIGVRAPAFGGPLASIGALLDLALKVESATKLAISALKDGKSPLFLLDNTANSLLDEMYQKADENGDAEAPDFRHVLLRTLRKTLVIHDAENGRDVDLARPDPKVEAIERVAQYIQANLPESFERLGSDYEDFGYSAEGRAAAEEAFERDILNTLAAFNAKYNLTDEAAVTTLGGLGSYLIDKAVTDPSITPEGTEPTDLIMDAREAMQVIMADLPLDEHEAVRTLQAIEKKVPVNYNRVVTSLVKSINDLPKIPVSPFDVIRDTLNEAGYTFDEITGRNRMIRDGKVVSKKRSNKNAIKDAFNGGQLDSIGYNRRGATAAGYHAGRRFKNQKQRVLIVLQAPADPQKFMQALGRINRFDQVIGPQVFDVSNGTPMEQRLKANQNTKLRRMSATTTANRDNAKLARDIPDIINSVGDRVVSRYLSTRPDLVRRLSLPENMTDDAARVAADNEETSINKRSANQVISRLSFLLPYEEQKQVLSEIEAEYKAEIAELDARNENPLKTREIKGSVTVIKRSLVTGIDADNVSAFDLPVYAEQVIIKDEVPAKTGDEVLNLVESGVIMNGAETPAVVSEMLKSRKNSYLSAFVPAGYANIDEAVAGRSGMAIAASRRFDDLTELLDTLAPGKEITMTWNGAVERGIITHIDIPRANNRLHPSMYDVGVIFPGDSKVSIVNMGSLKSDASFNVTDGLNGEDPEAVLTMFNEATNKAISTPRIILTGNEWVATTMAIENKLGQMTTYTDQNGMKCRGVLVARDHNPMEFLPVQTRSNRSCVSVLNRAVEDGDRPRIYGDSGLDVLAVNIVKDGAPRNGNPQTYTISLPTMKNKKFAFIYESQAVMDIVDKLTDALEAADKKVPNFDTSRPRIKCTEDKLERYLNVFRDAGVSFYAKPCERGLVNSIEMDLFIENARRGTIENINKTGEEENEVENHNTIHP